MEKIKAVPSIEVRTLLPQDLQNVDRLAQGVWAGVPSEAPHTWTALHDGNSLSTGAFGASGSLLGFSFNFIKAEEEKLVFWVHMIGVEKTGQNLQVGQKLMEANFKLLEAWLGEHVSEVALTSDPLVGANVHFFTKKFGFRSNEYLVGAYAEEERTAPSDRLKYRRRFGLDQEKLTVPGQGVYQKLIDETPESFLLYPERVTLDLNDKDILFIETPVNLRHADDLGEQLANKWRNFHRNSLKIALEQGFSAIDLTRVQMGEEMRQFIVCAKDFTESETSLVSPRLSQS